MSRTLFDMFEDEEYESKETYRFPKREEMYRLLYQMNLDAYFARYGEKEEIPEMPEGKFIARMESATNKDGYYYSKVTEKHFQIYKTLQCYLYQCSEGNVPDRKLYKGIAELVKVTAIMLVGGTEEYNNAKWG